MIEVSQKQKKQLTNERAEGKRHNVLSSHVRLPLHAGMTIEISHDTVEKIFWVVSSDFFFR